MVYQARWLGLVLLSLPLMLCSTATGTSLLDKVQHANIDSDTSESVNLMWRMKAEGAVHGWTPIDDGTSPVAMHRRSVSNHPSYLHGRDKESSSRHDMVRAVGILDAPPAHIFKLIKDNSFILQCNENIVSIRDLHYFPHKYRFSYDIQTKVAVSIVRPKNTILGLIVPREFHTIVSFIRFMNGTYAVLNRPAYILKEDSSSSSMVVKGSMLFSCNLLEPYGVNQTRLTQYLQINPGGAADTAAVAWILNRKHLSTYAYIKQIERAISARRKAGSNVRGKSPIWASIVGARLLTASTRSHR
jgi:START domain